MQVIAKRKETTCCGFSAFTFPLSNLSACNANTWKWSKPRVNLANAVTTRFAMGKRSSVTAPTDFQGNSRLNKERFLLDATTRAGQVPKTTSAVKPPVIESESNTNENIGNIQASGCREKVYFFSFNDFVQQIPVLPMCDWATGYQKNRWDELTQWIKIHCTNFNDFPPITRPICFCHWFRSLHGLLSA